MGRINTHLGSAQRVRLNLRKDTSLLSFTGTNVVKAANQGAANAAAGGGGGGIGGIIGDVAGAVGHAVGDVASAAGHAASAATTAATTAATSAYTAAGGAPPARPAPFTPARSLVSLLSPLASLTPVTATAAGSRLLSPALEALLAGPVSPTVATPGKILSADGTTATFPPKPEAPKVPPALEQKTLGSPSLEEILGAGQQGTLKVNAGGKLTVPATRSAAQELVDARKQYAATSRPDLSGLSAQERALAPYVLRAHKQYPDIPISVQMAQIKQESGFNPDAVSSAGAFGATQFMPETAASYGVKRGDTPAAIQSQITGQAHLLHDDNFATDPQGALSAYSGGYAAADYNNPILADAKTSYSALDKPTHVDPQAVQALKVAKQNAKAVGINPTPFNGDVERGPTGNTVFVRADAQGMVHWAESAVGTQEGSPKQLRWAANFGLGSSEPWCADFIGNGLRRRGVEPPSNPNYSGSYLDPNWKGGTQIGTDLAKAKPGDLVVFGNSEHIGLYAGNGEIIAGNYGNEVARYPASQDTRGIQGIVRPKYKGGKVAVHDSVPLPGSSSGSTFGGVGGAVPAVPGGAGPAGPSGSRPSMGAASLVSIASPFGTGPTLPAALLGGAPAEDPHVAGATEGLLALLGEEQLAGAPTSGRRPTL